DEMNAFLKDYVYMFAPTDSAFDRFNEHNFGASFVGFGQRRERGKMPAAMIRGEGRECDRPDNPIQRQDQGDLRVELRLPAVDCIGHPNKKAYQDQLMAPFDVTEAMVFMLYKGVKSWAKE